MTGSAPLFTPLTLRHLTLRNRIGVSPMCQYSSTDGFANDWHLAHIGARAAGGAGLIIMEATGVTPEGRISPYCLGLWKDAHIEKLNAITEFAKSQGAAIGIQLAHAGRKGSMDRGGKELGLTQGGWQTLAPSPIPFTPDLATPREMTAADIQKFIQDFADAAVRAVKAGFQIIEIHGAHGYLLHEFLSPLSNKRSDSYGGTRENRCRLILEVAEKIREVIPQDIVVGARLSCTDWTEGGITIEDSVYVSAELKKRGVDFIDCSSGFVTADAKVPFAAGFQVPFAAEIRKSAGIATGAVGVITDAKQADDIIRSGAADIVFLGREMLRNPYWAIQAAQILQQPLPVPTQYLRAF